MEGEALVQLMSEELAVPSPGKFLHFRHFSFLRLPTPVSLGVWQAVPERRTTHTGLEDLCEFEPSLFYIPSSRTAKAT